MYALQCMLDDDFRNTLFQDYMTTCISSLSKMQAVDHGVDWQLPTYYEMVYPEMVENTEKSGTEIVSDIIDRLNK